MKSDSFLRAALVPLGSAIVFAACTADQNLGSRGTQTDACAQASACCAAMPAATASACQSQLSLAQSQSDAQAACNVLLSGYEAEGLCTSTASSPDGGTQPSPPPDAGADGAPASASNEGVTLTVESSQQISNIEGVNVASGQIYVAVAVELTNGASAPLPLAFVLFSTDTTSGIEYTGSAETGAYAGGCDATTSLTGGHSASCAVVFEMPVDAITASLSYQLPDGAHVTVPLATTTCSLCSGLCTDLATDPQNCGSCGNVITGSNGTCVNGALACSQGETACGEVCTLTQTDSSNCGSCGVTCGIPPLLPGTCIAGACTVCSNGDTRCTSTTEMETCTENGQWGTATACTGDYVCTASACASPCSAGSALCGGTCIDIESDGANCGGCGLVCAAGCSGGECVTELDALSPTSLAVNATNLYFTTSTDETTSTFTVEQQPLAGDGGAAITLASGTGTAGAIAVRDATVYWVECGSAAAPNGAVMQTPIGGTTETPVVSLASCPGDMAVDDTNVYWTTLGTSANDYADGTIMKATKEGTVTTLAANQSSPVGIAVDGDNIYWGTLSYSTVNGGAILKLPLSGSGTPTTIASGQSPTQIAIDTNSIYWVDNEGDSTGLGYIFSAPLSGGTPVTLFEGYEPDGMSTDGTNVYFFDVDYGSEPESYPLLKMPVSGAYPNDPTTMGPYFGVLYYGVTAVDATSVYFAGTGSLAIDRITPK